MDNEDVIRNQMEDTRASLTDKLETLEQQVVDTVHGATSNVASTVEAVKESVQDTVTSVKDTVQETVTAVKESMRQSVDAVKGFFDVPHHVDAHPWAMVGGSVVVGFVVGSFLGGRADRRHGSIGKNMRQSAFSHDNGNGRHEVAASSSQPSGGLWNAFGPELSKLKGLAVARLMGAVRDMIEKAAPPDLGSSLNEIISSITEKLTGDASPAHPAEGFPQRRETIKNG